MFMLDYLFAVKQISQLFVCFLVHLKMNSVIVYSPLRLCKLDSLSFFCRIWKVNFWRISWTLFICLYCINEDWDRQATKSSIKRVHMTCALFSGSLQWFMWDTDGNQSEILFEIIIH